MNKYLQSNSNTKKQHAAAYCFPNPQFHTSRKFEPVLGNICSFSVNSFQSLLLHIKFLRRFSGCREFTYFSNTLCKKCTSRIFSVIWILFNYNLIHFGFIWYTYISVFNYFGMRINCLWNVLCWYCIHINFLRQLYSMSLRYVSKYSQLKLVVGVLHHSIVSILSNICHMTIFKNLTGLCRRATISRLYP